MTSPDKNTLRESVVTALESKGVTATPQAQSAIVHAISNSPGEIAGDSDSLLLGLLLSGSYTVDAIELAGANPARLRKRAAESLVLPSSVYDDGEHAFFHSCSASYALLRHASMKGTLETADIIRFAVAPVSVDDAGWELRENASGSVVDGAVRSLIIDSLVDSYCNQVRPDARFPEREFQERQEPLLSSESERVHGAFGDFVAGYVVAAMNQWFVQRRILTTPAEAVMQFVGASDGAFGFGAQLFMSTGGDYQSLEKTLTLSERMNPERDASAIVLCYRDGHVCAGQYTYRNSLCVDTREASEFPIQRLSVQAIRPVPLVASDVLRNFEDLLSSESLQELQIQNFLNQHPELITSFGGYTGAHPHLTLSEEGSDDLIPDYLLELPATRGFDIVDLKLPSVRLMAGNRYKRISHELQKAVAQLRQYRKYFDNAVNRKSFVRKYGLEPFRPEIAVVMGRSSEFTSPVDRREIEEQLNGTRLLTYDDLIAYGRSRSIDVGRPVRFG